MVDAVEDALRRLTTLVGGPLVPNERAYPTLFGAIPTMLVNLAELVLSPGIAQVGGDLDLGEDGIHGTYSFGGRGAPGATPSAEIRSEMKGA